MSRVTERSVEIEGRLLVCQKRETVEPTVDEAGICDGSDVVVEYSFDRGVTWHTTMVDAYREADTSEALFVVGDEVGEAGEFEAFVLALLHEVQALKPGETLRLVRDQVSLTAVKEKIVLSTRASTIKDVDLSITEGP